MTQPTESERVAQSMGLVGKYAGRYVDLGSDRDDLLAAGRIGILKGHRKFRPEFKVKFSTYAGYWVQREMRRELEHGSRTIRVPNGELIERGKRGELRPERLPSLDAPVRHMRHGRPASHHDVMPDTEAEMPDDSAQRGELRDRVESLMQRLDDRERTIIREHFWGNRMLSEIGVDLGVSRERVRQLRQRALGKMLDAARKMGLVEELAEVVG